MVHSLSSFRLSVILGHLDVLKYSRSRAEEKWGNCCGPHQLTLGYQLTWVHGDMGTLIIMAHRPWHVLALWSTFFSFDCPLSRQPNTYTLESLDAPFLLDHLFF